MALGENMRKYKPVSRKIIVANVIGETVTMELKDSMTSDVDVETPVIKDTTSKLNESAHIIIKPSETEGDNKVSISMEGALTVDSMSKAKKSLLDAINEFDYISVTFNNVIDIDLSCVQLLLALKKTCAKLNKQVEIDMKIPDNLKLILNHSGFSKI